jgi:hypothetical protein
MGTKVELQKDIDAAIGDLEQLADEVCLKLHLAEMDARDVWEKVLEPRLEQARRHAKEATAASKATIDETVMALREFARTL